ncbi:hypothetical protein [Xanthobacter versatilis]|uniref:hypothetical protein n=1 Tax=Xanthobacter autotrophicus (strain ATCC BAA-1158 / Py2) TaxID=78245 RepID=UPI00372C22D9
MFDSNNDEINRAIKEKEMQANRQALDELLGAVARLQVICEIRGIFITLDAVNNADVSLILDKDGGSRATYGKVMRGTDKLIKT